MTCKLCVNIDGFDRAIYDVGDGIQSILIMTYPMFMSKKAFFFIEEPELHIHPGMQRKLIEIFDYFQKNNGHYFFCTTHSNHFLDKTFENSNISIYNFKKLNKKNKETNNNEFSISLASSDSRFSLNLLGVQNSSIFLSNCVVWVEGPSDRLYFKKFIELVIENETSFCDLKNKLKEGIHYCFSFTGGSTINHFDFTQLLSNDSDVSRFDLNSSEGISDAAEHIKFKYNPVRYLCGRSMVIVDNDASSDAKAAQKSRLQKALGIDFCEYTKAIEVENLLPYKGIIKAIKNCQSTKAWVDVEDSKFKIVSQDKIYHKRLGSLIISDILPSKDEPEFRNKFRDGFKKSIVKLGTRKGATLSSQIKTDFALTLYERLEYSDFEENIEYEALTLTRQIIQFILKHNPDLVKEDTNDP